MPETSNSRLMLDGVPNVRIFNRASLCPDQEYLFVGNYVFDPDTGYSAPRGNNQEFLHFMMKLAEQHGQKVLCEDGDRVIISSNKAFKNAMISQYGSLYAIAPMTSIQAANAVDRLFAQKHVSHEQYMGLVIDNEQHPHIQ